MTLPKLDATVSNAENPKKHGFDRTQTRQDDAAAADTTTIGILITIVFASLLECSQQSTTTNHNQSGEEVGDVERAEFGNLKSEKSSDRASSSNLPSFASFVKQTDVVLTQLLDAVYRTKLRTRSGGCQLTSGRRNSSTKMTLFLLVSRRTPNASDDIFTGFPHYVLQLVINEAKSK
jgi:hypothetical protein